MTIVLVHPHRVLLTVDYLHSNSFSALYVGDDVAFRFQLRDSIGVAISLASALVSCTIRSPAGVMLVRRSDTMITGTTIKQIAIDADQSVETGDTGRGWYQVNFASTSGEVAALTTVAGSAQNFEIIIRLSDTNEFTHMRGSIDIVPRYGEGPLP